MEEKQKNKILKQAKTDVDKELENQINDYGKKKKKTLSGLLGIAVLIVLSVILGLLYNGDDVLPPEDIVYPFSVSFVDVGQGDGIVIESGDTLIVVDGGEVSAAGDFIEYINSLGQQDIDLYIATHPHSDHIGASPAVFSAFDIKEVMLTSFSEINIPTTKTYEKLLTAVQNENCKTDFVKAGDSYNFGDITVDILAPVHETDNYNNMSVVAKITYKNVSFLLMGDAEKPVENEILENGCNVSANVLKVGHHGSSSSTGSAFLKAVDPSLCVISCGKNNDYGHPHKETIELLKSFGAKIIRTDNSGTVVVYSDGSDIFTED